MPNKDSRELPQRDGWQPENLREGWQPLQKGYQPGEILGHQPGAASGPPSPPQGGSGFSSIPPGGSPPPPTDQKS